MIQLGINSTHKLQQLICSKRLRVQVCSRKPKCSKGRIKSRSSQSSQWNSANLGKWVRSRQESTTRQKTCHCISWCQQRQSLSLIRNNSCTRFLSHEPNVSKHSRFSRGVLSTFKSCFMNNDSCRLLHFCIGYDYQSSVNEYSVCQMLCHNC